MQAIHHKIAYYSAIGILIVITFVGYIAALAEMPKNIDSKTIEPITTLEDTALPAPADVVPTVIFERIPDDSFIPSRDGKLIRINLETMILQRFNKGRLIDVTPIVRKGVAGSPWETPSGTYTVNNKEEDYYSEKANAWFPYSMHLFGNYFIHGIPHDKNNHLLTKLTDGDIRLSSEKAKVIFDWADLETKVSIYSDSKIVPEPILSNSPYIIQNGKRVPNVSAESYLVADLDNGDIILEKNKDDAHPIASVSKLMTTLVSLDTMNQFDYAKVTAQAISAYGTSGLIPGEKIQLGNLLYPLLMPSSNDAAEVIAENLGRETFIQLMNNKAKELGMINTAYEDPSGLTPKNVSTVQDLFTLARYIKKEKSFVFDLTTKDGYSAQGHSWRNYSQFLNDTRYTGGKSGFTEEAKQSVIATFNIPISEFNTRHIAIVLLRSNDRYIDTMKLLSFINTSVSRGGDQAFRILGNGGDPDDVILSFTGDIMLDRGVEYSVNKNLKGNFYRLFDNVSSLAKSDIFFTNLEGPVSDKGEDLKNLYSFRMDTKVIDAIKGAGVDVVSFANNHVGDWGRDAFDDTIARLKRSGIGIVGAGINRAEAENPFIIEKKGIKFGFIGFSDVGPESMSVTESTSGILLGNDVRYSEIIKEASKKVDILIVSMHAGVEYVPYTERQELLAHKAIDAGARLFIGSHPHVAQDVETYKGGIIAYSLGNFIFDQAFSEDTMHGMVLDVTVNKGEIKKYEKKTIFLNEFFQPDWVVEK